MSSFFRSANDSEDSSSDEEEELTDSGDESGLEGAKAAPKAKKTKGSDDDSDDSDDDSDDDDEDQKKGADEAPKKSRFLKAEAGGGSDSDESDDERTKVVKSAKSKRLEELEASVKAIDNAAKINDWAAISNGSFFFCFFGSMSARSRQLTKCLLQNSTNSFEPSPVKPMSPKLSQPASSRFSPISMNTSETPRLKRRR